MVRGGARVWHVVRGGARVWHVVREGCGSLG